MVTRDGSWFVCLLGRLWRVDIAERLVYGRYCFDRSPYCFHYKQQSNPIQSNFYPPTLNLQLLSSNHKPRQLPTCNLKPPAPVNMQPPTSNLQFQPPTINLQPSTLNLQPKPSSLAQPATSNFPRPT